jgi:hypothetical protein
MTPADQFGVSAFLVGYLCARVRKLAGPHAVMNLVDGINAANRMRVQ